MPQLTPRMLPPRLVVADLSLLRGRPRSYRVPLGVGLVIPGTIVEEVLETLDSEPGPDVGQSAKFHDLFDANRGRVFLGRGAAELDSIEHGPDVRLDLRHVINFEISEHLMYGLPPLAEWVERGLVLQKFRDRRPNTAAARQLRDIRASWRGIEGDLTDSSLIASFRRDPKQLLAVVNDASRAERLVESVAKFAGDRWAAAVRREPLRYSWPRFIRLMDWYGAQSLLKPDASEDRLRNDHHDIDYVHLASYIGTLATADRGMTECATAVFPKLAIVQTLP